MAWRAVILDLGGVVLDSPLHTIAAYERERGLPAGAVNRLVVAAGPEGAWSRLERGELDVAAFVPLFDAECAAAGHALCTRTLMERISEAARPRPRMLEAIGRIRAAGLRASALTNNWVGDEGADRSWLHELFDAVVESSAVGLRKPDPRIYALALERLGVAPAEVVFLDDIGRNLKPARALGMHTIKVEHPDAALDELAALLGLAL